MLRYSCTLSSLKLRGKLYFFTCTHTKTNIVIEKICKRDALSSLRSQSSKTTTYCVITLLCYKNTISMFKDKDMKTQGHSSQLLV